MWTHKRIRKLSSTRRKKKTERKDEKVEQRFVKINQVEEEMERKRNGKESRIS